jgi:hypothetical protein
MRGADGRALSREGAATAPRDTALAAAKQARPTMRKKALVSPWTFPEKPLLDRTTPAPSLRVVREELSVAADPERRSRVGDQVPEQSLIRGEDRAIERTF